MVNIQLPPEAGHADLLAFEVVGRLDFFAHREGADKLVDKTSDEDAVEAVQYGAKARTGCRAVIKMRFARGQSRKRNRRARHEHQLHVEITFAEIALILRDDQQSFALAEARRRNHDLRRRHRGG